MTVEVKTVQLVQDLDYEVNATCVICRGSVLVELLVTQDSQPQHYVHKLYVPPQFRGQGVATRLMQKVMEIVPYSFVLQAEPWADEPMTAAHLDRWYKRLGLSETDSPGVLIWQRETNEG